MEVIENILKYVKKKKKKNRIDRWDMLFNPLSNIIVHISK